MARFAVRPPVWFWLVSVVLLLWEAMGVWSWWEQVTRGAAAMGATPTDYDLRYYAALPAWYAWLYGAAVWTGLAGGALLLARKQAARPIYTISLLATVAMFAWTFLATDLIAAKGIWVSYFPAAIIAIGAFSLWWAGYGVRRGWLR